jgi:DnaD/phage-associated family protein
MKAFSGFSSGKVESIAFPEPIFTELIPLIDDVDELKVTLHILYLLSRQKGHPRYVLHKDLLQDELLLGGLSESTQAKLEATLERSLERGTLLRTEIEIDDHKEVIYFANSPRGRAALEALRRGEPLPEATSHPKPNVFKLYEENIGPLTPLIAEELEAAETSYPMEWIADAFREAVTLNKRSWKYIRAILARWSTEGRDDEAAGRDPKGGRSFVEGKYGEFIDH